jgi:peptidoglycan/xylan/chitin deacetylase (PgdA/CDA1 family)
MLRPLNFYLVQRLASLFPDAVFYQPTAQKQVAITIDDVGGSETADILAVLDGFNQTANPLAQVTFFVITDALSASPNLLSAMSRRGHEIGNHGRRDHRHAALAPAAFQSEIQQAHEVLSAADVPIRWFRPGQVLYTQAMLDTLRALPGYHPQFALGSVFPMDTRWPTWQPAFTLPYLRQFIFPGAILVLHGGTATRTAHTVTVLKHLLPDLQQQGYQIVTLSQLWDAHGRRAA